MAHTLLEGMWNGKKKKKKTIPWRLNGKYLPKEQLHSLSGNVLTDTLVPEKTIYVQVIY